MSKKSEVNDDKQVYSSEKLYIKEVEAIEVGKFLVVWEVQKGYPPMQMFLPIILYHLSTYFHEKELFETARNVPANQWSGKWRMRLNIYNVSSLLAIDFGTAGIFLKNPAINQKEDVKVVFAGCLMETREMIECYYRLLISSDLCGQKKLKKTYRRVVMTLAVEQLSKLEYPVQAACGT